MDSFILVAYANTTASRTFLQQLLACLNFTLDSEFQLYFRFILIKQKSNFYELWQQHKLLKTVEMSEVLSDIYDEGHTHHFQPEHNHKKHW